MDKHLLVGTAVFIGMTVGCSSGNGMGGYGGYGPNGTPAAATCTASSAAATTDVSAVDFSFQPSCIRVNAGQTVTWTSEGANQHTVTSNAGDPSAFDSGTLNMGQTFSHMFPTAGTFNYHCNFHVAMGMVGTVIVQ